MNYEVFVKPLSAAIGTLLLILGFTLHLNILVFIGCGFWALPMPFIIASTLRKGKP